MAPGREAAEQGTPLPRQTETGSALRARIRMARAAETTRRLRSSRAAATGRLKLRSRARTTSPRGVLITPRSSCGSILRSCRTAVIRAETRVAPAAAALRPGPAEAADRMAAAVRTAADGTKFSFGLIFFFPRVARWGNSPGPFFRGSYVR